MSVAGKASLLKRTSLYYFMQNLPKRIRKRIVLYAKDVENIPGKKQGQQVICCKGSSNKIKAQKCFCYGKRVLPVHLLLASRQQ